MPFKVRNLMIHVLPDLGEKSHPEPGQAQDCWLFTPPPRGCLIVLTHDIYTTMLGSTPLPSDPEALATLKGHLQEALANVQAQEQKVNEQMAPQTVEEAQTLENHLAAALEEVQRQKAKLQNKATEGQE